MEPSPQLTAESHPADRRPRGRVFVIDDDPAILEAYAALLEHEGLVCACFPSATDFLQSLPSLGLGAGPVCVLCDVKMPGLDGLALLRQVRHRLNASLVLMSGESGAREAVQGLKEGADDFLVKPIGADELLSAIEKGLEANRSRQLHQQLHDDEVARLKKLAPREIEAIYLVVRGFTNAEVAERMGIALRTIKRYRQLAMETLGLDSLTDLVRVLDAHRDQFDPWRRNAAPRDHDRTHTEEDLS